MFILKDIEKDCPIAKFKNLSIMTDYLVQRPHVLRNLAMSPNEMYYTQEIEGREIQKRNFIVYNSDGSVWDYTYLARKVKEQNKKSFRSGPVSGIHKRHKEYSSRLITPMREYTDIKTELAECGYYVNTNVDDFTDDESIEYNEYNVPEEVYSRFTKKFKQKTRNYDELRAYEDYIYGKSVSWKKRGKRRKSWMSNGRVASQTSAKEILFNMTTGENIDISDDENNIDEEEPVVVKELDSVKEKANSIINSISKIEKFPSWNKYKDSVTIGESCTFLKKDYATELFEIQPQLLKNNMYRIYIANGIAYIGDHQKYFEDGDSTIPNEILSFSKSLKAEFNSDETYYVAFIGKDPTNESFCVYYIDEIIPEIFEIISSVTAAAKWRKEGHRQKMSLSKMREHLDNAGLPYVSPMGVCLGSAIPQRGSLMIKWIKPYSDKFKYLVLTDDNRRFSSKVNILDYKKSFMPLPATVAI